jgi:hypothetical protein
MSPGDPCSCQTEPQSTLAMMPGIGGAVAGRMGGRGQRVLAKLVQSEMGGRVSAKIGLGETKPQIMPWRTARGREDRAVASALSGSLLRCHARNEEGGGWCVSAKVGLGETRLQIKV